MKDERVSRRAVIASAAALAIGMARAAGAAEKIRKVEAKYQDTPKGQQRCEICLQFRPPNRCAIVEGEISPKGWCQFFAAKENAR